MIILGIASLIGILIGLHYNVLAMVPAALAVILVSCASAMVGGVAISTMLFGTLTSAIGLQAGYMIGLTWHSLTAQRFSRLASPQSRRA